VRAQVGSLCSGYGGLDLAVMEVLSAELAWCADNDPHVSQILATRFPGIRNLGDITGLDWAAVPPVDVITAGFPCQDISFAGRGAGLTQGARSSVWTHVMAAVRHLRPSLVVVENVAALRSRGLDRVIGSLAGAGLDSVWCCLHASDTGAPHQRARIFVAAYPAGTRPPWGAIPPGSPGRRPPGQPQ
jgi:DNA (cytosine-5)-methyltransferase 1